MAKPVRRRPSRKCRIATRTRDAGTGVHRLEEKLVFPRSPISPTDSDIDGRLSPERGSGSRRCRTRMQRSRSTRGCFNTVTRRPSRLSRQPLRAERPSSASGTPPRRRCTALRAPQGRQAPRNRSWQTDDLHVRLLRRFQAADRPRRTHLPAEGAAILAVTDPGHQDRRPDPSGAASVRAGCRPPSDADLHTLAHLTQRPQETPFPPATPGGGSAAGPPVQPGRPDPEKRHRRDSCRGGSDNPAPSQVQRLRGGIPAEAEGHGILRAGVVAVSAEVAFGLAPFIGALGEASTLTAGNAGAAGIAPLADGP